MLFIINIFGLLLMTDVIKANLFQICLIA